MKKAYRLYQRKNRVYYLQNNSTGEQKSLGTSNRTEADRLLEAKNHTRQSATLNLQIGTAYLTHADPTMASRTWQEAMDELKSRGTESSKVRYDRAMRAKEFDLIRNRPIIKTTAEDLRVVLKRGGNATNNFLRRLHNIALENNWIPFQIIPAKKWDKTAKKQKRSITQEEHEKIIAAEKHPERRRYYEMLWLIGASQSDGVQLKADNFDWCGPSLDCVWTWAENRSGFAAAVHLKAGVPAFSGLCGSAISACSHRAISNLPFNSHQ